MSHVKNPCWHPSWASFQTPELQDTCTAVKQQADIKHQAWLEDLIIPNGTCWQQKHSHPVASNSVNLSILMQND